MAAVLYLYVLEIQKNDPAWISSAVLFLLHLDYLSFSSSFFLNLSLHLLCCLFEPNCKSLFLKIYSV